MTDIAELIERLEKAMGPDRRLDFDLWAALTKPAGFPSLSEEEESRTSWFEFWKNRNGFPRYSESIDAALTLVPEGFQAYVGTGVGSGYAHACVWTDHPHRISGGAIQCFSPAIALAIAALKAR